MPADPSESRAQRALLAAAPAALACALALRPVDNWDLGFHLRLGELILAQGIPTTDPFSFPGEGQRWALEQWLGPVAFHLAFRAGGIAAVIAFKAAVAGAAFLVAGRAAARASGSALAGAAAALLGVAAAAPRFNAQPNVLSLAGLALVLLWCAGWWRAGEEGRPQLPGWPWLLGLFALWPHLHPGYLTGLAALAAAAAGALLQGLWPAAGEPERTLAAARRRTGWRALGLAAACAAAAAGSLLAFHPLGAQALGRVLSIFSSDVNRASIAEYAPLWRSYALTAPLLLLWGIPLAAALARPRQAPLPLLLPALLIGWQALQVGRLLAEAALAATPACAAALAELFALAAAGGATARLQQALRPPRAAAGLALVAALAAAAHLLSPESRPLGWTDATYPEGCYRWIDQAGLPPRGFNDLGFGGSFIFHFGQRRKTFIDGRSFYSDRFFLEEYTPIKTAQPGFAEIARRWGIGWYLLHPSRFRALHQALQRDPGLRLLHLEPNCAVYGPPPGPG